ncbi:MAG: ABC transporter substrate-binding protein [Chloroflexi bacterium]|nr:ABC transporter substrate-binding protein [Chloroflexota bacterium]
MTRIRSLSAAIAAVALVAVACGGAAAPTATPTARPAAPAATAAPAGAAAATPTRPVAPAVSTPTPTRAAAATQPPSSAGPIGKMTMASVADITNLDVHVASAGGLTYFYQTTDVNAVLVTPLRTGGGAEPYLAESWSWDEKGLKIRYVIRKGAGFHNGKPVTAQDVVCTADKIRAPYSARGHNSGDARWVKTAAALDSRTVVFSMPEVYALGWTALGLIAVQPCHEPYETMQRSPVGAGPYKVVEWRPFESLTMEASPYWWDANKVQVKTIVRLVVPEPESRLAMLKSGQIDFMDEVQPRQAEELFKDKRFRVKSVDGGTAAVLHFSTDTKTIPGTDLPNPFLDVRVRRAFIMAVDRKAIFEGVALGKYGVYVPGPWTRTGAGGSMEDKITPYPYDPKAARKLLDEAKFPFEREWPFWVYRTTAGFAESAEVAVANWNAIGIKARMRITEVGTLMSYWQEKPSRTYPLQFIRAGTGAIGEPNSQVIADSRTPEGRLTQFHDDEILALNIRLRSAFEPAEREAIFREIYLVQHEKAIQIPLLGGVLIYAFNQRVDWEPVEGTQVATHLWRSKWLQGGP